MPYVSLGCGLYYKIDSLLKFYYIEIATILQGLFLSFGAQLSQLLLAFNQAWA